MNKARTDKAINRLAADFTRWGKVKTERVRDGVQKWGTQFYDFIREEDC